MDFALPINFFGFKSATEATQSVSLDFQNGLQQGNASLVETLILDGVLVNQPLPNGELPLHLAVRSNHPEVVSVLLRNGADPEIKDFQNLTAIEHAVLMHNENLLITILGHKIGNELKGIQEQIKCKGSASHVNQLKSRIQKLSTVDVQNLTPINRAAYQGNLESQQLLAVNINDLDANGLAPIHYAILGNQTAVVEKLIGLGSKVNMTTREGDSLAHFAAMSGSRQTIELLKELDADLNHKNSTGATPLHYASAIENLTLVETLVKGGANPHLLDNQGMSPLALIGSNAFQKDPLSLPNAQVVLFAASSLFWVSSLLGPWAISSETKLMLLLAASAAVASWSECVVLVTNLDKTWKKAIAWICMFGLGSLPPFSVGFQAWRTYHVARSAFEGLKKCWNNAGYRNWAVTRNVVVYSVNTANSISTLYSQCVVTYEIGLHATYWLKMAMARNSDDKDAFLEAYEEYLSFFKERYKIDNEMVDVSQCVEVSPSTLVGLSTIERLRKPELNPKCPEHALMMMSPDFTMDELRSQGVPLFKKTYQNMMLTEVHPDKAGQSEAVKEAAARLNAARDTLKKWVEKNT